MTLRDLMVQIKEMKHYFAVAALIFIVGIYMGVEYSERFQGILDMQGDRLRGIVEYIGGKENERWWLFGFIFLNNTILALLMVFAGAFFGMLPIYFLVMNGLFLGYQSEAAVEAMGWGYLFKGILPHGIIEIPAIIIASAFGIRFGMLCVKGLIALPFSSVRSRIGTQLLDFMKATVPMSIVLAVLLLAAAIIESTLTLWILGK